MYSCRKIVTIVTITKKIGGSCVTSNLSGKGYLGKYEIQFGGRIGYYGPLRGNWYKISWITPPFASCTNFSVQLKFTKTPLHSY